MNPIDKKVERLDTIKTLTNLINGVIDRQGTSKAKEADTELFLNMLERHFDAFLRTKCES